jgi:hypothetical protein
MMHTKYRSQELLVVLGDDEVVIGGVGLHEFAPLGHQCLRKGSYSENSSVEYILMY